MISANRKSLRKRPWYQLKIQSTGTEYSPHPQTRFTQYAKTLQKVSHAFTWVGWKGGGWQQQKQKVSLWGGREEVTLYPTNCRKQMMKKHLTKFDIVIKAFCRLRRGTISVWQRSRKKPIAKITLNKDLMISPKSEYTVKMYTLWSAKVAQ